MAAQYSYLGSSSRQLVRTKLNGPLERTIYSVDDKVDYYLHKIAMAPALRLDPRELYEVQVLDEEAYLIDQVMLESGLIKIERESRVITSKGLEISNFGGWTLHQRLLSQIHPELRLLWLCRKQRMEIFRP